jgi:hypothetical protein
MAGPLLAWIYPRRLVERDLAQAERAALGSDAFRVFVVVPDPVDASFAAAVGTELAEAQPRRPAEVVLAHLVPYARPGRLEVGSGLSGELLEMTRVMGELERLAAPVRARGLAAPVLARLSSDPLGELPAQVVAADPDVVVAPPSYAGPDHVLTVTVRAPPPPAWTAVVVRLDAGVHGEAALRVAAAVAAAHDADLVVDGRPARRLIETLTREDRRVRVASTQDPAAGQRDALIVAPEGGRTAGAHLTVRAPE